MRLERLLHLARPGRGHRVVLITGPAGSGKSTLLRELRRHSSHPVVSVTVTSQHRSQRCLLDELELAHRALSPGCGPWASADDLVDTVTRSGPQVLILDDVHLLEDTEAGQLVDDLLESSPPGLELVLSSRRIPRTPLSHLRVSGELVHVEADDLRFRSWEVEDLFRRDFDQPLAPEEAAELTRRTEGWAAALQMFHLATAGRPARARRLMLEELSHHSRHLGEYLAEVVLDALPTELRDFLAETFALDVLTGPLCDALRHATGSAEVLRELVRRQVLTSELAGQPGCFRYHEVLRSELEALAVESRGRRWVVERHETAARALEESGHLVEAACSYARAGRWDDVARLAGANVDDSDVTERIELIPTAVARDDGHLLLAQARRQVRAGAIERALRTYEAAAAQLDGVSTTAAARCRRERIAVAAWVSDHDITPSGWLSWLRRLTRTAGGEPPPGAPLVRAVDAFLAGDADRATGLAAPVADGPAEDPMRRLVAALVAASAAVSAAGELIDDDGAMGLRRLGQEAWDLGHQSLARMVWSAVALSTGDDALEVAVTALEGSRRAGDVWGEAVASFYLGWGLVLRNRPDDGAADLGDAADLFERLGAPVLARHARGLLEAGGRSTPVPADGTVAPTILGAPGVAPGAAITIRCFGSFGAERDGAPMTLDELRPQGRTLLRILAVHGNQAVHREVIAAALWPELGADQVRSRLQVVVSGLRQALGVEPAVERTDDAYRLAPDTIAVDTAGFEAAVSRSRAARRAGDDEAASADLRTALELYAGPLLADEGPAEWVVARRDQMQQQAADAALELAALELEAGRPDDARRAAEQGLVIDRHRDDLWRLLLDVHRRSGNPAAEAEARTRYRQMLDELGLLDTAGDRAGTSGPLTLTP